MTTRARQRLGYVLALVAIFAAGIAAAAYVLVHERLPVPFRSTYDIRAQLTAADGVVPGLGQPVNVAGVQVGSIVGARVAGGLAVLTLQIQRDQLPHVYANAGASLAPITPLGDIELDLSPGHPPAPALAPGTMLTVGQTTSPGTLEDLLSSLDTDTRTWLQSLISSLGTGVGGHGQEIQRVLADLGPSAGQVREITAALATRRESLARLVHNLALLTRAATSDGQLSRLVVAGDQTLHALAAENLPLEQSTSLLPGALAKLDSTLADLRAFSGQLTPTVAALLPAVRRLPATLASIRPFASAASVALSTQIRPFVRTAVPLVTPLGPATADLERAVPFVTSVFQVANYFTNELAYNPQGRNQGYLYWMDWFFHNWDSVFGAADANGVTPRANILVNCDFAAAAGPLGKYLETALGVANLC